VGEFAHKHVARTFLKEFGKLPAQIFASFDEAPIASASVAQVHRATLRDGTDVAVKVRRPHLEQIVAFDLRVMRMFARIVSIVPSIRLLAPVESVEEFARSIRAQIDFTIEAGNNRRFHQNFADDPDVTFPELVEDYCSARILTMKYVTGVKVLDFRRTTADPTKLARIGFHTLLKMVFEDGFVHADLHPGNIFITESNKVVILDLGLTSELDESHRNNFARFFGAWAAADGKAMTRLMLELSTNARVRDYDALEAEVVAFVAKYYGKALGEVKVSTVAFDVMNIVRHHRVRVDPTFTMCIIAIAVTEGIGKQLDPKLDLMQEALPFFVRLQAQGKL
jgi:ubiquinone biosynthesis protein